MKTPRVFKYLDYKVWLRAWLEEQGHGGISRLAKELGCQRSYLSQVLTSHIQLTPDQCFRLGTIAFRSEIERKYLQTLVEFSRAGDPEYKRHLREELGRLSSESERLGKLVGREKALPPQAAEQYYSAWFWTAIHIITSIEPPKSEKELAESLRLDPATVKEVLQKLNQWGLIEFRKGFYRYKSGGLHLPSESPLLPQFHKVWRDKAIANFTESSRDEGVHMTVIQTLSKEDAADFKSALRAVIQQFETLAGPSKSEVLVNFNIDFGAVTKS